MKCTHTKFWCCTVQPLDEEDKPKVACEFVTQVIWLEDNDCLVACGTVTHVGSKLSSQVGQYMDST